MAERDSDPGVLLGDRGYDSNRLRQDARDRGAQPEIPTKRSRKVQHSVSKRLYVLRARIECFINRLKNCRRVATLLRSHRSQLSRLRAAWLHPSMDQVCPRGLARVVSSL